MKRTVTVHSNLDRQITVTLSDDTVEWAIGMTTTDYDYITNILDDLEEDPRVVGAGNFSATGPCSLPSTGRGDGRDARDQAYGRAVRVAVAAAATGRGLRQCHWTIPHGPLPAGEYASAWLEDREEDG